MKNKLINYEQAVDMIHDGSTLLVGGFLGSGTPMGLIDAIVKKGVKDLTIISNDTAFVDVGIGKLICNKQVKKFIGTHIGTNKETQRQMNAGELEVVLIPQGTYCERMRAAGAGLGGFLTPTGVGTLVAEGKQTMEIDGKKYLLEMPLKADVAIIAGTIVDKKGNVRYKRSFRNFSPIIATAGDIVIVEAEEIVEVGAIDPDDVMTPYILVDYIVGGAK